MSTSYLSYEQVKEVSDILDHGGPMVAMAAGIGRVLDVDERQVLYLMMQPGGMGKSAGSVIHLCTEAKKLEREYG